MNKKTISITGVAESRSARKIAEVLEENKQGLILVSGRPRAERLASDLSFFCDRSIYLLPEEEQIFLNYKARSREDSIRRLTAQKALRSNKEAVIIAPISAAIKKLPPHRIFDTSEIRLEVGEEADFDGLKEALVNLGYERGSIIAAPGQFSLRGGIVDLFPPDMEDPVRIEFFDTQVESIRTFDVESQRSIENLSVVNIYPAKQMAAGQVSLREGRDRLAKAYDRQIAKLEKAGENFEDSLERLRERKEELLSDIDDFDQSDVLENYIHYFYEDPEYIWDYMQEGIVVIEDPKRIEEYLNIRRQEALEDFETILDRGQGVPEDKAIIGGEEDYLKVFNFHEVYTLLPFPYTFKGPERITELINENGRQMSTYSGHMEILQKDVDALLAKGYAITVTASSKDRLNALKDFFSSKVSVVEGNLSNGMELPKEKIVYISDNDIFGSTKLKKKGRRTRGQQIQSFTDLNKGDFVVHENHGVGKFLGIEPLIVEGEKKDYISIKYAGKDMLYVPVEQMDVVQKYIGSDGVQPKINRLSGDEWNRTKQRAKAAIREMTDELIKLYAERKAQGGFAFGEDTVWQKEFEASFPFEETEDQLRSAEEIKEDMERDLPMDRLLCGDVGYGKTEVAARAIFKCLENGKQAAILVPTTILANQHYNTLKERFSGYPFKVDMLSRFRTDAQQKETVKELEKGMVDLIIGTHRLLSKDVKFKDLGLLVVDEEQRFGVKHKEEIKKLKANVDVLTLSATPIPRTLNMSLSGIRDMSLITEPPEERYPVQTYVMEEDDQVLREVIMKEIDRGGQVFVVFNRVRGIYRVAERLGALVPEARIAVGHGQMNERVLEDVMEDFISGKYNVLVATTIIESGIDIQNANTMVVLDADKCGLSQLYQLRGRVGRSNRVAYAYLTYKKEKVLTETAVKRLRAIKEFTEFGSGFKIAMRDLEIRGAGNLLGAEQSGHMMSIGYELYCKLVDEAVRQAQGEAPKELPEEITVEIKSSANIPSWYIDDEIIKLQMYKKISLIESPEDVEEVMEEMVDRFGDLPKETLNLIKISFIRKLCNSFGLNRIYEQRDSIVFEFQEDNNLTPFAMMKANQVFGKQILFHGGVEPYIRLMIDQKTKLDDTIALLRVLVENKDKRENA